MIRENLSHSDELLDFLATLESFDPQLGTAPNAPQVLSGIPQLTLNQPFTDLLNDPNISSWDLLGSTESRLESAQHSTSGAWRMQQPTDSFPSSSTWNAAHDSLPEKGLYPAVQCSEEKPLNSPPTLSDTNCSNFGDS